MTKKTGMWNCGMIDSVKMEINKEHIGHTKTGLKGCFANLRNTKLLDKYPKATDIGKNTIMRESCGKLWLCKLGNVGQGHTSIINVTNGLMCSICSVYI